MTSAPVQDGDTRQQILDAAQARLLQYGYHKTTMAEIAEDVNRRHENIGARRLHTLLERVLEDVSFAGPDQEPKDVVVDAAFVDGRLADIVDDVDLSRYVL